MANDERKVDAHNGLGAIHASRASCSAVGISSTVVERTDSFSRYDFLHKNCSTKKRLSVPIFLALI